VAFASGLRTKAIQLDFEDASLSSGLQTMILTTLEGDITSVSRGSDSSTLMHLAPFGVVRQQPINSEAYSLLNYSDAEEWDAVVSGRAIKFTWETSSRNGFIITDYGNIISFGPLVVDVDESIMVILILGAVLISVPGVFIGLIYMNSPFLQRKYQERRDRIWKKKQLALSNERK